MEDAASYEALFDAPLRTEAQLQRLQTWFEQQGSSEPSILRLLRWLQTPHPQPRSTHMCVT
jgi:hypothetical protein